MHLSLHLNLLLFLVVLVGLFFPLKMITNGLCLSLVSHKTVCLWCPGAPKCHSKEVLERPAFVRDVSQVSVSYKNNWQLISTSTMRKPSTHNGQAQKI